MNFCEGQQDFGDPSKLDIPEEIGEWQEAESDN